MKTFLRIPPAFWLLMSLLTPPALARAASGDVDPSFDPGSGVNNTVFSMAMQPDGKVIIGGEFTTVKGLVRKGVARLNADGSGDVSFNLATVARDGTPAPVVRSVGVQADGKTVMIGTFNLVNGVTRNAIARLSADGSLDAGFDPGTGPSGTANNISSMALQPDGKALIGGGFTIFNGVGRNRIARLNSDGSVDTSFNPGMGPNDNVFSIALQSDGKVLIGGSFTTVSGTGRNRIARLNTDGSLDMGFDPGTGANSNVNAVVFQPDGKVMIGGLFGMVNDTNRLGIARLNSNGSLDTGFSPGIGASTNSIALQTDGKVLIGASNIIRLNSDGSVDATFNPGTGIGGFSNSVVHSVVVQSDGKVLVGGRFWRVNGISRDWIARLGTDGGLDATFNPGTGITGTDFPVVLSAIGQSDDKTLVGGIFTTVNGVSRNNIARLNADGSLDASFNPSGGATGPSATVNSVVLQPDGKVLIGGGFNSVNGVSRPGIARLNADGSLDTSFALSGSNSTVNSVALQSDGKVLIGGTFFTLNGVNRNSIARLNINGSVDAGFNPGTGASLSPGFTVYAIAVQSDDKVLVAGDFTTFNGSNRSRIARLNGDGSVDSGFNPGTGPDNFVQAVVVQANGKVLIGGRFGTVSGASRSGVARLNADGSLDTGFSPADMVMVGGRPAIALQSDGKVLVAGSYLLLFDSFANFYAVLRLNTDGSRDTTFTAPLLAPNSPVEPGTVQNATSVALQADGRVLVGGSFTKLNTAARWRVARLLGDLPPGTVDCATTSLQGAINAAQPGSILTVIGTCNENVLVRNEKQRITIDGGGTTTIHGPSAASPALNVRGKGILIQGFTITGGSHGVYVNRGSNAVINNNHIHSADVNGVTIDELAFAVLINNTIENNPGAGVFVSENSTARIGFNSDADTSASANTIQNNGVGGIIVSNGSSARVIGNMIQSNTGAGVLVTRDSLADIANNLIDLNTGNGITVTENSGVSLGEDTGSSIFEIPNSSVSNNGGFGYRCNSGSYVDGRAGTLSGSLGTTDDGCLNSLIP